MVRVKCSPTWILSDCTIADSSSIAVMRGLPPSTPILLRVTKDGFVPELKHLITWNSDGSEAFTRVLHRDVLERWAASRKVTLDPSRGHIAFFALGGEGGDLTVSQATGTPPLGAALVPPTHCCVHDIRTKRAA